MNTDVFKYKAMLLRNHFILAAASLDDANAISNDIIFTLKDRKFYVLVVTLSAKDNQKLWKLLSELFVRSVYWNENKEKWNEKHDTWV